MTQGCVSKAGVWMELTEAQHAGEALDHIQELDGLPPTTLPREGNHIRRTAPTGKLPTEAIDWKEILPGVTTVDAIHFITPDRVSHRPAEHRFIIVQGTATIEGTTLGEDDQMPEARPTQAIWVTENKITDTTINPNFEWDAIHYTVECTDRDPKTNGWQTQLTTAMDFLSNVSLDNTLTPKTMEPAKRATEAHQSTAKITVCHYGTTIHLETVSEIKEALFMDLPGTHNAHQRGAFTVYWSFPMAAGMVPQVAEPALPATLTALPRAVQAMAQRGGTTLDWTPNTLVEQPIHHNTNKAQQTERQIHAPLWDKEGNLQPHSP